MVSVSYATGTDGTSSLTVRVPTSRVQDAITRLSSLGTIVAQQVQIDDLQESIDALGKRITGLQDRIARLTVQIEDPSVDPETRATLAARRPPPAPSSPSCAQDRAGRRQRRGMATIQLASPHRQCGRRPATPTRFDRTLDQAVEILAWEAIARSSRSSSPARSCSSASPPGRAGGTPPSRRERLLGTS